MKKIFSNILSFLIALVGVFLVFLLVLEISISKRSILNNLDKNNYYDMAYQNIVNKTNDYIVNEEIRSDYEKFYNLKMVKEDIKVIIDDIYYQGKTDFNKKKDLENIILKYTSDNKIIEKYTNDINDIYLKNIFPIREMQIINKVFIGIDNVLLISIFSLFILIILFLGLYYLNHNFSYHRLSLLTGSLLLIFPLLFIKLTNLLRNFLYSNEYFTKFILKIINYNIWIFFGIGILMLTGYFIVLKSKKTKNDLMNSIRCYIITL